MEYFIADTHFGDIRIHPFYIWNTFPKDLRDQLDIANMKPIEIRHIMDEYIIKAWNDMIDEDDIVYHLGDVCYLDPQWDIQANFTKASFFTMRLKGRKRLILGNHDDEMFPKDANSRYTYDQIFRFWQYAGFEDVRLIDNTNEFVFMRHRPPEFCNRPYFTIYGHVHMDMQYRTVTPVSACVSCERWGFRPVSYQVLDDLRKDQELLWDVKNQNIMIVIP